MKNRELATNNNTCGPIVKVIDCFAEQLHCGDYWGAYLTTLDHLHRVDATDASAKRMSELALAYGIRSVLEYLSDDLSVFDGFYQGDQERPEPNHIGYVLNLLRAHMPKH